MPTERTPRRGRILALLLAAALCAGGCGGGGDEPELSAQEVVARAVEATGAEKSFHFLLEVENPPRSLTGLNLTFADGEVSVPERLRANVAGTFAGISLESELISIGEVQYLKEPFSGRWREVDIGTNPIDFFDLDSGVLAVLEQARDIELDEDGDAFVITGGVEGSRVSSFLGTDEDSDLDVDVEVRVGKDDFLLRELRLIGPVEEGEPEDVVRVVTLSQYGVDVTIEPPDLG
jgi:lipoprotein LprG